MLIAKHLQETEVENAPLLPKKNGLLDSGKNVR